MKFTLSLLIVAAVIGCVFSCSAVEYDAYKLEYNKVNKNEEDNSRRLALFCANLEDIEKHNKEYELGHVTYKKGINQFTDVFPEEMTNYMGWNLGGLRRV
ncbi:crustapain-like [Eupeodes corollae]|uniref:crustapain-like n=1 Tax=Eupeodes corollae TaxID=290404 RepID=UPI00249290AD|nr:crustapain-like [Eupeodes corollae]